MAYSVMLLLEYKKITNNCENLVHVTCLAHGLNRVAESIRMQHPQINGLISNVKKVLLKSPLRVQIYKEKLPDVPLPPEPVITRWGGHMAKCSYISCQSLRGDKRSHFGV